MAMTSERAITRFVRMAIIEGELPVRELRNPRMYHEARVFLAMQPSTAYHWAVSHGYIEPAPDEAIGAPMQQEPE